MDFIDVVILSTVEGVTEFLPVSSTAHLILTSHILGLAQDGFLATFEIAVQMGAIAAVSFLYIGRIIRQKDLLLKTLVGFLPTGILGFLLFDIIKSFLTQEVLPVITLFLGGVAIIIIERFFKARQDKEGKPKTLSDLTYKNALTIGLIQSLSMVPGVSRAAASIFGTMSLGFDRKTAVEYSFLLAIPTMTAATGYDLYKSADVINSQTAGFLLLGVVVSFVVAYIVAKWLLRFVTTHDFFWFGIYRIVLSIVYALLFLR